MENIKKSEEYAAVYKFLKWKDIEPLDKNFKEEETTTDFEYSHKDHIFKFQVTTPDGEVQKLLKRKTFSSGSNYETALDINIIKPIEKKFNKYRGVGVSDTILLIHAIIMYPFLEKLITENKRLVNKIVEESGFESVFFVPQVGDIIKL